MGAESHLEKSICDYARKTGWLAYKFSSPGHRAVPDRLFISPYGLVVFMEIKAAGRHPTPLQTRELERLRNYKVPAIWVDNLPAARIFLDQNQYKQPTTTP